VRTGRAIAVLTAVAEAAVQERPTYPPAAWCSPRRGSSDPDRASCAFGQRDRRWLDEVVSGSVTDVRQIAARQRCSVRQVNMTISLAFLAPELVRAAVEGRLPRGIGVERLRDAPTEWSQQFEALGLNPQ
jgi:hypothetical protein